MASQNDEVQQQHQQRQQHQARQQQQQSNNSHRSSSNNNSRAAAGESCETALRQAEEAEKDQNLAAANATVNASEQNGSGEGAPTEPSATCARGKLNDLVADLCLKNPVSRPGGIGDYTNIRATVGPLDFVEGLSAYKPESQTPDLHTTSSSAAFGPASASTTSAQPSHVQPTTQNSSFSFKHFLNSGNAMTAPSSTVTSLDPVGATSSTAPASAVNISMINLSTAASSSNAPSTHPLQTSTGARPKVPQSASVSATSISSLMSGGLSAGGATQESNNSFASAATKMKRSPRFSSFDSQASLAEYAGTASADNDMEGSSLGGGGSSTSGFRLCPDALCPESNDIFSAANNSANVSATATTNYERQYVPRSYSNYDMPMPASSPRRRLGVYSSKETRPNRLALNMNVSPANSTASKLKLDLPIDSNNGGASARPLPNNGGEFPAAAAAAALPDFVQDHWLDSWYAHEMHLNSPPNSPICDFVQDLTGAAIAAANCDAAEGNVRVGAGGAAATCGGPPGGAPLGSGSGSSGVVNNEAPGASKMLPDFLSDGPIIHSSQRLADVAAGLPSNSMGSPEDPPMSSQLTRMRIENDRLQRELAEARVSLNEQTRRANDLERQLQDRQRNDAAFNRSMSQNISLVEESLDKNKKRTAAAQSHVTKLKQQVTQLTAEVETLRRENDVLREDGAVGGCSATSCDRPFASAAAPAAAASARGTLGRPSRTQQFSRDLLMAASNAENNLRQLLVGVDNLRQMASDIENSDLRLDYDVSPDLFSDFIDDCDYEEYPGGPAL